MKNYIKSAPDTLVALDFRLDHEDRKLRTDRWIFTHANSPDERLTLNYRMSEQAARTVVQKARAIVGLSSTETGKAPRVSRVDQRQKAERAAQRQRDSAAEAAQRLAHELREAERLADARRQQVSQLDRLMRGPGGHQPRSLNARCSEIPVSAMLTLEQVADLSGFTDKAVARAVESGALEAYMCGKQVKVRGADVREWLKAAS